MYKGADAALAEDDILVALGHDVLGAHHELLQRIGKNLSFQAVRFRFSGAHASHCRRL